jgi:hypothetical protein
MGASLHRAQGHQILSVGGSEDSVVVNRVLLPGDAPTESLSHRSARDHSRWSNFILMPQGAAALECRSPQDR